MEFLFVILGIVATIYLMSKLRVFEMYIPTFAPGTVEENLHGLWGLIGNKHDHPGKYSSLILSQSSQLNEP
jgi:hypothetical protein